MPDMHILAAMSPSDERLFFNLALKHHIERLGRGSVSSLAIDTGLSQPQISRIMSGRSLGSVESRVKIADALGTTVEQMLILGRSITSGERRIGTDRRAAVRSIQRYPHLIELVDRFPVISRYIEMAELAAAENDLLLMIDLLGTALRKFSEALKGNDDKPDSGDSSEGAGGGRS